MWIGSRVPILSTLRSRMNYCMWFICYKNMHNASCMQYIKRKHSLSKTPGTFLELNELTWRGHVTYQDCRSFTLVPQTQDSKVLCTLFSRFTTKNACYWAVPEKLPKWYPLLWLHCLLCRGRAEQEVCKVNIQPIAVEEKVMSEKGVFFWHLLLYSPVRLLLVVSRIYSVQSTLEISMLGTRANN